MANDINESIAILRMSLLLHPILGNPQISQEEPKNLPNLRPLPPDCHPIVLFPYLGSTPGPHSIAMDLLFTWHLSWSIFFISEVIFCSYRLLHVLVSVVFLFDYQSHYFHPSVYNKILRVAQFSYYQLAKVILQMKVSYFYLFCTLQAKFTLYYTNVGNKSYWNMSTSNKEIFKN